MTEIMRLEKIRRNRKMTKAQVEAAKWRQGMLRQFGFAKRPVHAAEVASRWGRSKNYLGKVIAEMILEGGVRIGSSRDGYFEIRTSEDLADAMGWLKRTGFKRLLRCAVIARMHVQDVFNQAWEEYRSTKDTHAITRSIREKGVRHDKVAQAR